MKGRLNIWKTDVVTCSSPSKMNDVIISGLVIKPRSYLQAVKGNGSESRGEHDQSTEEQVKLTLKPVMLKLVIFSRLRRLRPTMPATIIRSANRKHKIDLLRRERKRGKIQSTWTIDCKVFIKPEGAP